MNYLKVAGASCLAISALHVAIMIGGPAWFRYFGAGEELAQLAEQGTWYPVAATSVITIIFALFGAYAFSGAGKLPRMPLLKLMLGIIAAVFLIRGLAGVPMVLFGSDPEVVALGQRMGFVWITSLVSFLIGVLFVLGVVSLLRSDAD